MTAPWITYRPEIKVLDATIRDGGLINNSNFTDDFVKAVYETNVEAGVDYMEIGYKNSKEVFPKDEYGPWRHCDEEDLVRIVGENNTDLKLAAMADVGGKSDWAKDIIPKDQSPLDLIRVACYVNQINEACEVIQHCHEMGYEVACNIMALSDRARGRDRHSPSKLLRRCKSRSARSCVVDSFGSLYGEQVELASYEEVLWRPSRAPARRSASTPTTTSSSLSPTPLKRLSAAPTASMPPLPAWDAAQETAPWNSCSDSCAIPNIKSVPSGKFSRSISQNSTAWNGVACRNTSSRANSTSTPAAPWLRAPAKTKIAASSSTTVVSRTYKRLTA